MRRRDFLTTVATTAALPFLHATAGHAVPSPQPGRQRRLYIAQPGIRNYQQYGGVGVLVYDIDRDYAFVRRIPTWAVPEGGQADNVKGVAASAATGRLWVSTIKRLACSDLATDRLLWDIAPEGGCDRLSASPDGRVLYVPSFEGPHWNVIDGLTGAPLSRLDLHSAAHNTLFSRDGSRVYLEGLKSPYLSIADARTHQVVGRVGPFSAAVRPFTVNAAQTHCFVNVNELLGFEVGDIRTGQVLHKVVVEGYRKGPVARHACPSHGIGLTPDERELWLSDGHNQAMHVFDATVMPPRQKASIPLRDQPGWITFSLDGTHAWPSTGQVFDTRTRALVKGLKDEQGRDVGSEKLLEVDFEDGRPVAAGNQFGVAWH